MKYYETHFEEYITENQKIAGPVVAWKSPHEKSKKIYPDPVKRQSKKNRLRVYLTKHFPYFFKK
jgi:hypothetical protein